MKPLIEDHVKGSAAEGQEEEDDESEDEGLMMTVVEVLAAALKTHGAVMVGRMQPLLPMYGQLLGTERSSEDKCAALNTLVCQIPPPSPPPLFHFSVSVSVHDLARVCIHGHECVCKTRAGADTGR
eukprot:1409176-Rhodomonas_salina.9